LYDECVLGKSHRLQYQKEGIHEFAIKLGVFFHYHVCGSMSVKLFGGALYFVLIKNDHSGYCYIDFVKKKLHVFACFQSFEKKILKDIRVKILQMKSDRKGEYTSKAFAKYLENDGVINELAALYSLHHNGRIEIENRTIVKSVRSMLYASGLFLLLWAEACNIFVYTLNWMPTTSLKKGHLMRFEKKRSHLSHILEFLDVRRML
jgi:hypothetical protein